MVNVTGDTSTEGTHLSPTPGAFSDCRASWRASRQLEARFDVRVDDGGEWAPPRYKRMWGRRPSSRGLPILFLFSLHCRMALAPGTPRHLPRWFGHKGERRQ
jgi:hypothetical protein